MLDSMLRTLLSRALFVFACLFAGFSVRFILCAFRWPLFDRFIRMPIRTPRPHAPSYASSHSCVYMSTLLTVHAPVHAPVHDAASQTGLKQSEKGNNALGRQVHPPSVQGDRDKCCSRRCLCLRWEQSVSHVCHIMSGHPCGAMADI